MVRFQLGANIKAFREKKRKLRLKRNGQESCLACKKSALRFGPSAGLNRNCAMPRTSKVQPGFLSTFQLPITLTRLLLPISTSNFRTIPGLLPSLRRHKNCRENLREKNIMRSSYYWCPCHRPEKIKRTTTLAKKIETGTHVKLQARACSRAHAPVPAGAWLSQFFWPG